MICGEVNAVRKVSDTPVSKFTPRKGAILDAVDITAHRDYALLVDC